MRWLRVTATDAFARALADRHYPRENVGAKSFPPGTTVTITGSSWRGRTGTVVALDPSWPDYRRVEFDAPFTNPPQLVAVEHLRAVQRAGQMGLFGGVA